jgi:hypothetical protein
MGVALQRMTGGGNTSSVESSRSLRLHLPGALRSTGITRLHRYYGSSDSCQAERCTRQVSLLHGSNLPTIPSPTTPRRPEDQFWFESSGLPSYGAVRPGTPLEQVSLDVSWASPLPSRLAATTGRIEFVILRTSRSPPDALHLPSRERSFVQLQGAESPWQGLAPCWFDPLANALGRCLRHRQCGWANPNTRPIGRR